ncbi:hypothetical protein ACTFIU_009079 [Dictyostelium citrinum]
MLAFLLMVQQYYICNLVSTNVNNLAPFHHQMVVIVIIVAPDYLNFASGAGSSKAIKEVIALQTTPPIQCRSPIHFHQSHRQIRIGYSNSATCNVNVNNALQLPLTWIMTDLVMVMTSSVMIMTVHNHEIKVKKV